MNTRELGASGLRVGCIGLGAMPLSIDGRPSEDDAIRVIHAALDGGMTLIDTADAYCLDDDDTGHNERLIARALKQWGGGADGIVVATKGACRRPHGDWTVDARPEHLRRACEQSLRALGVEAIDLYQLHAPDPRVPFAESVGALAELRREGKIRQVGLSNVSVAQIAEARGLVEVVSVQNRFNPLDAAAWTDGVIAACEREGLAFLPYSPVGGHHGHVRVGRHAALGRLARARGITPYQLILAWLLALSPAMIPIPGASRVQSARASAEAASIALDAATIDALHAAFPAISRGS